ncbi:MAG: trypsin-like peptidase domain-containing protein [Sandaracinaceae bacterium]|nr:trypsin-like peptidase domain-containing protein [Sandaracinaceae bacterium]
MRAKATLATLLPVLLAASAFGPTASAQDLTEARRVEIARRLAESTVSIAAGPSSGSGFVVGDERWIVTNSHVIAPGRRSAVRVHFSSGTTQPAVVLLDAPSQDLAILRVEGSVPARPLPLAAVDRVAVGQTVLAFGSPFGLEGTLTQGIVSALRDVPPGSRLGGGDVRRLIQTDAPINPGNSGGPLVNSSGEVIGVNTAILSRTGGSHGIGFAIPSSHVTALLAEVRDRERQARAAPPPAEAAPPVPPPAASPPAAEPEPAPASSAFLGILGDDFRGAGLAGVRIRQVVPGSPAATAGLAGASDPAPAAIQRMRIPWTGHIILAVDGRPTRSMQELQSLLARRRPGDRTILTVTVGPGVLSGQAVVTLGPRPDLPDEEE